MAEPNLKLHVAVFPWLALGHMIPYLQLSKLIARKGHTVSFISTARNISRLPNISSDLSVNFVSLPLSHNVDHLPENAEATTDVPGTHIAYLKKAFDGLSEAFSEFLEASKPNWIVYDILHHWVPPIAEKLSVRRAIFCTFNAASIVIISGPASVMIHGHDPRKTAEDLTVPPPWVLFETNIVYRLFEARRIVEYPTAAVEGLSFGVVGASVGISCGRRQSDSLEISRNERDGLFMSASVADRLLWKKKERSTETMLHLSKRLQDHYADGFIEFLENPRAGVYSK
ncbi:hypothetical protein ARALYDRAFT_358754 [Arabidopsis lyrata subsp. lyrata]|uniref:UDP-glucoronosyl/UDP-glucosyl transferase family protein n=1 Tax=Arabidopsis lyrata subsp. lyrata TaxID=81972 RepID=D7MTZ5_ARALL|nr:hypothetical protein ARALYDRAFT_358754 [Arabidopsis lyrata subsp. lyrata]